MQNTRDHSTGLPEVESADFVAHTIGSRTRVLDVGCGPGLVAAELMKRGKDVIAIDTNAERVVAARELGVDAHVSAWPGFDSSPVDVVLFGASLHHMTDVGAALSAAGAVLEDSGVVVADEFAYEAMDAQTAEWLADRVCEGVASGFIRVGADPLLDALLAGEGALGAWTEDHHGHVTPSTEMVAAAESLFEHVEVVRSPYLYRYLVSGATAAGDTPEWIELIFNKEKEAIEGNTIAAIGRRIVMAQPSS